MKPRRVILELEVETDVKVEDLRRASAYLVRVVPRSGIIEAQVKVLEARANVIRKEKK